jgi:hypothetical protein
MIICGRLQKTLVIRETLPGSTQTATSLRHKPATSEQGAAFSRGSDSVNDEVEGLSSR